MDMNPSGASQAADGQRSEVVTSSGDPVLEAVDAALDPEYNDVEGMRQALENAMQAGQGGNLSVQILEAKYGEAKGAGSSGSDEEESLQDRIDAALDPSFDDRVAMRQLLDEADATYFQHPMVSILRTKFEEAQAHQAGPTTVGQVPRGIEPVASASTVGEDESEEEEEEDAFNVDAELPTFKQKPQVAQPTGAGSRRGSVVQFGGRRMSMSVGAELQATAARLRNAVATGDATQMQAALDAAAPAATMDGPGAAEVQQLAMEIASRLATDDDLRRSADLRRSHSVRAKIRRMWDVMVVESAAIVLEAEPDAVAAGYIMGADGGPEGFRCANDGGPSPRTSEIGEGEVTKGGYKLLHMRVSKVLTAPHLYRLSEANDDAEAEWDADVARFLGTSHIMVWLDSIRTQFHTASKVSVMEHGLEVLFKQYDDDGNGELDMEEFTHAVRDDLHIERDVLPDHELRKMFYAVDADRGGSVDSREFTAWLMAPTPEGNRMKPIKDQFRAAAEAKTQAIGWKFIFDKYDDDGSGELDLEEFKNCVRRECGLSEETTTDEDVEELFGIVDTDQSGAIDAEELRMFLTTNLEAASITFAPFLASIFELTALWVPTESEAQYSRFLDVMFNSICFPCNGHSPDEGRALEKVPVIEPRVVDSRGNLVPNFRLRPLDEIETLILRDGNLDGFDAQSIAGLEAAERARLKAEARREAWRREQERKRLVAEEARRRREAAKMEANKPPRQVTVDSLEMLMGFRWHDGYRWHEGMRKPAKKKGKGMKKRKKAQKLTTFDPALDNIRGVPSNRQRATGPLHYNPATHTIRQKPRPLLPKLKDPAEAAHVAKPTVMMHKGNRAGEVHTTATIEITDKKQAIKASRVGEVHTTATTDVAEEATVGSFAETEALSRMQPDITTRSRPESPVKVPIAPVVKHAFVPTLKERQEQPASRSEVEGWTTDASAKDEQPETGTNVASKVPTPPSSRHTSGRGANGATASAPHRIRQRTAELKSSSGVHTSTYIFGHQNQRSASVREVSTPPGSSTYVPVHAVLARTSNRAWSPRLMSAGANGGAGFRGFMVPSRLSPQVAAQTNTGIGYIHTLAASQRTAAHTNAIFDRMSGGVELPQRSSTARERIRPVARHGASSVMTARPWTAGQAY